MERLELDVPDHYPFSTQLPVRVGDLNYGGHLGNDAVLSIAHEARIRYLKDLGHTELDVGGPGLIMANAEVQYRSEGVLGDELTVRIAPANPDTTGFDLFYRMEQAETGEEVARVRTGMVAYDYDAERPVPLPESFIESLRGFTVC